MHSTRIHLVRHGQVEGFETKRYNGQGEVPLTAEGKRQYERLRSWFASIPLKAAYSSDLSRCVRGAEIIGADQGLTPVLLPDLRELDVGDWEGRPWVDIERREAALWQARLKDIVNIPAPGGETLLQLAQRVRRAIREITCRHRGEDVLVVGHGGVNRVILLDALGASLDRVFNIEQSFACYNKIAYHVDGTTVTHCMNVQAGDL